MKRTSIAVLIFVLYIVCVVVIGMLSGLPGKSLLLFILLLALVGVAALLVFLWYQKKYLSPADATSSAGKTDNTNLEALIRDADLKLKQGGHAGAKSVGAMPLIYVIGHENSAKTQTILQSGLEPELLAGQVYRDQSLVPTQSVNIWLAGSSLLLEAGGQLMRQPASWLRLLRLTQPSKVGAAFTNSSKLPTRAVVVCVSIERMLSGNTAEQIRGLAQTLNERLRQLSQTLGISLPVYVLFTKIDTIPTFADYAAKLTLEEVRAPLGSLLASVGVGAGLYAERATEQVGSRFDELVHSLSEFRLEVLSRGGEADVLARAYEFPRDMRKLRTGIVDFLVELARPSQLGVNPFLRGFFFTGMRAYFVEDAGGFAPPPQLPIPPADSSATSVFSFSTPQARPATQSTPPRTRKVPQWVFLPHLFANIVLTDKSALESSRASTKVNFFKRCLLATACAIVLLYLVVLTVSYVHNSSLEERVAVASQVQAPLIKSGSLPSPSDLQNLDKLGQALIELKGYRDGHPPMSYRWGLYDKDALYSRACQAYGQHFQRLLLSPTQGNILNKLRSLSLTSASGEDYGATYRPLKAYLITTSNHDKGTVDFLAPALNSALGPSPEITQLAQSQFTLYASLITEPCMASVGGDADRVTVVRAQAYLNSFSGFQHIYESLIDTANRKSPSVSFNTKFPEATRFISDSVSIPGAYTKDGFAYMQDAIQHPEHDVDDWVVPPLPGTTNSSPTLKTDLRTKYIADYIAIWHKYLTSAQFLGYRGLPDAAEKLDTLDSSNSPILKLFWLVSVNTGVAYPEIKSAFSAPQSVVPPTSPDRTYKAPSNDPYLQALSSLQSVIKLATQGPAPDPATAAQPVLQAAENAHQASRALRNNFGADDGIGIYNRTFELLEAPITSTENLAGHLSAAGPNGAAQAFCGQIVGTLGKFPFNSLSTEDASLDEVAKIFQPGTGSFAQLSKNPQLAPSIAFDGSHFARVPGSKNVATQAYLNYLNAMQEFSSNLYAAGNQPSLNFTLTELKVQGVPDPTLSIDSKQLSTAGLPTPFQWISKPDSSIVLRSEANGIQPYKGPWSVFHFARSAIHPKPNRLEFNFSLNGQTKQTVDFDVSGQGRDLLEPGFMATIHNCVQTAVK
jgi:type VI secretion system protein ImpL